MVYTSLVTGGAGFIGSHVARQLLTYEHQVIILDDLSGGFIENIPKGALFEQGSITDASFVALIFKKYQIHFVYHFAAYAAEGLSHFIRRFNYQNNLIGSINLINAAVNYEVKCFVFTSSIAVYGTNKTPFVESSTPCPEDPYGIAKYAVELDLKNAFEIFGLPYVIFRPHNVYGPNQNIGDPYRNVIGIFMNQLLKGESLTIFGDGKQTRCFSYITDIVSHIANVIQYESAWQQTYNIGSDTSHTILELATGVCEAMELQSTFRFLEERKEVTHAISDHSKFQHYFSPGQETSLREGLTQMAHWAKTKGEQQNIQFSNIEIAKGLPNSWK